MLPRGPRSVRSALRIDHVIFAATDLDAAAARIEAEYGLRAAGGGRHEGLGTHNRIVPLGGGYLEILGVADPDEAARSQLGRALADRIAQVRDGLMGWAVAVDDVVPVAERLGSPVSTIVRQGLSARLTGVLEAMATPFLPFFLARDEGMRIPATREMVAVSSGSRWPAIRTASMLGWAGNGCGFASSMVRLVSARWLSAVGSFASARELPAGTWRFVLARARAEGDTRSSR